MVTTVAASRSSNKDPSQHPGDIGTSVEVRASEVLTTSFVTSNVVDLGLSDSWSHVVLVSDFTIGSLTDVRLRLEWSDNDTDFDEDGTFGEKTLSATIRQRDEARKIGRYVRAKAKGTGTVTSSLLVLNILPLASA